MIDGDTTHQCKVESITMRGEPKLSDWRCELFGSGPRGLVFRPVAGREPNFFWRWMQYLCFGNRWTKGE